MKDEKGQAMVEYTFIIAVVVLALVAIFTVFSDIVIEMYNSFITLFGLLKLF